MASRRGLVGVGTGTTAGGRELDRPELLEFFQADHVLFGTDHPMPGCGSLRGEVLNALSSDERGLIESGNLDRLLA